MAGEINRVPEGLLSILDMKSRGQNPRNLADTATGVIDLLPLYLQQNRVWHRQLSATVSLPGVYTTISVPENQSWWVHNVGITTDIVLAGASTDYVLGVSVQRTDQFGSLATMMLGPISARRFVIGDRVALSFQGPYLAGPGTGFGIYCVDFIAGTAAQMYVTVDHTPIPL